MIESGFYKFIRFKPINEYCTKDFFNYFFDEAHHELHKKDIEFLGDISGLRNFSLSTKLETLIEYKDIGLGVQTAGVKLCGSTLHIIIYDETLFQHDLNY